MLLSGCRTAQTPTAAASPCCSSSLASSPNFTRTRGRMLGECGHAPRDGCPQRSITRPGLQREPAPFTSPYTHCAAAVFRYNLLFFVSGGGKFNYQGTKRWLEDNLDHTGTAQPRVGVFRRIDRAKTKRSCLLKTPVCCRTTWPSCCVWTRSATETPCTFTCPNLLKKELLSILCSKSWSR